MSGPILALKCVANGDKATNLSLLHGGDTSSNAAIFEATYDYEVAEKMRTPVRIRIRRLWRGRRAYTEREIAEMDCPYPPEPDL